MKDDVVSASIHLQQLKDYDSKLYIETTIDQIDVDLVIALDRFRSFHTYLEEYRS